MATLRLLFAVTCYLLFFATFLYLVGFVTDLAVPRSVDTGPAAATAAAILIDAALIAVFGLQHSVMARPGFKRGITRVLHPAIERSFYVLATVAVLWLMFALWRPIPAIAWSAERPSAVTLLWALCAMGWGTIFISTWLLDHFELFGLKQAWTHWRGLTERPPQFRQPLFYRFVRHPIYLGMLFAFWAIPTMTWGHLLFAGGMTVYILIGIRFEEQDLIAQLGEAYTGYRKRVGMLIPGIGKAR